MNNEYFLAEANVCFGPIVAAGKIGLTPTPAVYIIENQETGKFYVGSTININCRAKKHLTTLNNGKHANKKLQEQFDLVTDKNKIVMHVCFKNTVVIARAREQLILDEGFGHESCLNVSNNVNGPSLNHNKITNLSENATKRSDNSKTMWLKDGFRENHIRALGDAVIVDGILYPSVREASRKLNVTIQAIRSRMINGNIVSLTGMRPFTKKVSAGGVIYDTVAAAAIAENVEPNTMTWRCQNKDLKWSKYFYL